MSLQEIQIGSSHGKGILFFGSIIPVHDLPQLRAGRSRPPVYQNDGAAKGCSSEDGMCPNPLWATIPEQLPPFLALSR